MPVALSEPSHIYDPQRKDFAYGVAIGLRRHAHSAALNRLPRLVKRSCQNLTLDGKRALRTLLAANKRLNTAYLLKESFGQLWSYLPTLSDLIKACGDIFHALRHPAQGGWQAFSVTDREGVMETGIGETPDEAVARVWLTSRAKRRV